jgi:adenosylcobinamide-GDP ribazoletransferase
MLRILKLELRYFIVAWMFYTRLPSPVKVGHRLEDINKATRYFPLIGWIVGGISGFSFWLFHLLLPVDIAILLSMATSIFITGAFHEDGLADVCDGFGGGWTKQRILDIMKDSRSGAFAVVGIAGMLLLKFNALQAFEIQNMPLVLWAAHSLSRWCAVIIMTSSRYVRENDDSKVKPLAKSISAKEFIPATFFGLAPLFFFIEYDIIFSILAPLAGTWWLNRYFTKWIGGYTGDCLGATQQVTEVLFYLSLLMLWRFT